MIFGELGIVGSEKRPTYKKKKEKKEKKAIIRTQRYHILYKKVVST